MTDPKALVRRLVDDVINAHNPDVLDEIATPALARTLRRAFDQFRSALPDWHQEIVGLVAEGSTVVARFRCTGTHQGRWQGLPPTGRTMNIDEGYFFRTDIIASPVSGASKTPGPATNNSMATPAASENTAHSPKPLT